MLTCGCLSSCAHHMYIKYVFVIGVFFFNFLCLFLQSLHSLMEFYAICTGYFEISYIITKFI